MAATALGIVLIAACLCLGYLAFRRVRLMRGGGVDLNLRRRPAGVSRFASRDASAGWHSGVARYRGDELAWFRLTSFRPGASLQLDRNQLEIVDRRLPADAEAYVMPTTSAVLRCRSHGVDVELAMTPGVLMGFLAWLEAAPPGRSTGYRQAS
ncbi:DUF2550 domain-containing protein [Pseudonocardia broussonetiae]|uniref:DUF2550 domain-containing protein n=1 Tax=Pseudonocardia broussonetiae TaxID=2736640 RepID=A0A6M6JJ01_9PSEU|nr:DUF2550 domain-containing protein [Pseudonocardia broussonetiae]QJY46877.1 DUF2550 domain-containing protein [Pseudonocardia broussonetiae]